MRIFSAFSHYLVFITVYLDVRFDELYLRELLQLEVHAADLGVEGVVVKQVGAVELLVVGLVHSQQVFLAFENLNLNKTGPKQFKIEQPSVKSREQDEMINYYA